MSYSFIYNNCFRKETCFPHFKIFSLTFIFERIDINHMGECKDVVEILSMQNVNNFGSLLQAYSLKKIIESIGFEVRFLDIMRCAEDDALLSSDRIEYLQEYGSASYVSKLFDGYLYNRIRNKIIVKEQNKLFSDFRISHFSPANLKDLYEACVIGSDEVFNCLQKSPWGFTSQLFGNVTNAKRVVTYAACCGFTNYNDIPPKVVSKIKDSFKNIISFSVRDNNTYDFVNKISGKNNINIHLDPALIGDFNNEISSFNDTLSLPDKYCLIYSYPNRIYNPEEILAIKSFCREYGMDIVSIGIPQMWIKNFYAASPFELLKAFQNASFVFTDTFHGAVFSAKYSKKFAVVLRGSNKNKLFDLITRLNLTEHMIKDDLRDLKNVYNLSHDKEVFNQFIMNEYERTTEYLFENLKI